MIQLAAAGGLLLVGAALNAVAFARMVASADPSFTWIAAGSGNAVAVVGLGWVLRKVLTGELVVLKIDAVIERLDERDQAGVERAKLLGTLLEDAHTREDEYRQTIADLRADVLNRRRTAKRVATERRATDKTRASR